jgi:hypothetical protein
MPCDPFTLINDPRQQSIHHHSRTVAVEPLIAQAQLQLYDQPG